MNEIFANLGAIKHGVEGGDLVYAGGGHFDDLGDLVHGSDGEPTTVLTLGEVKKGNDARLFIVGGVFGQDLKVERLALTNCNGEKRENKKQHE